MSGQHPHGDCTGWQRSTVTAATWRLRCIGCKGMVGNGRLGPDRASGATIRSVGRELTERLVGCLHRVQAGGDCAGGLASSSDTALRGGPSTPAARPMWTVRGRSGRNSARQVRKLVDNPLGDRAGAADIVGLARRGRSGPPAAAQVFTSASKQTDRGQLEDRVAGACIGGDGASGPIGSSGRFLVSRTGARPTRWHDARWTSRRADPQLEPELAPGHRPARIPAAFRDSPQYVHDGLSRARRASGHRQGRDGQPDRRVQGPRHLARDPRAGGGGGHSGPTGRSSSPRPATSARASRTRRGPTTSRPSCSRTSTPTRSRWPGCARSARGSSWPATTSTPPARRPRPTPGNTARSCSSTAANRGSPPARRRWRSRSPMPPRAATCRCPRRPGSPSATARSSSAWAPGCATRRRTAGSSASSPTRRPR